jgi:hypothetical protein
MSEVRPGSAAHFEELALAAEKTGDFAQAIVHYEAAAAASLGRSRRNLYREEIKALKGRISGS